MKYYKKELWRMMQSSVENERETAKIDFREKAKKYGPYFDKIRGGLPSDFIKLFDDNRWFHDFKIHSIQVLNSEKESTITIDIHHEDKRFRIDLEDVSKISVDVPDKGYWMPSGMTWGYTEFEELDEAWRINILCDINCELEFVFKNIEICNGN